MLFVLFLKWTKFKKLSAFQIDFYNFITNKHFQKLIFLVMTTPKKSIKKGPANEVEDRDMLNDHSIEETKNKKSFIDDEDEDFDVPLDDLDTFDDFIDDEDDDNY